MGSTTIDTSSTTSSSWMLAELSQTAKEVIHTLFKVKMADVYQGPPCTLSGVYTYHLDEMSSDYQVVTEFSAWDFPHSSLPSHWQCVTSSDQIHEEKRRFRDVSKSEVSTYVITIDKCCLATKYRTMLRSSRLVPDSEGPWFDAQDMRRYILSNEITIDNVSNTLTLRHDIHQMLREGLFVFYPTVNGFSMYLVSWDANYAELLHGRPIAVPARIPVEFLHAHFAFVIIQRAKLIKTGADIILVKEG